MNHESAPMLALVEKASGRILFLTQDASAIALRLAVLLRARRRPQEFCVLVPSEAMHARITADAVKLNAGTVAMDGWPDVRLTPREKQTLEGIRQGLANKEIAVQMDCSERTVKFFVGQLFRKFGVRHRWELMD